MSGMHRHDAALARALGAEGVERRRRLQMEDLEARRRVGGGGQRVVHQRRGQALAAPVIDKLRVERIRDALDDGPVYLALDDLPLGLGGEAGAPVERARDQRTQREDDEDGAYRQQGHRDRPRDEDRVAPRGHGERLAEG